MLDMKHSVFVFLKLLWWLLKCDFDFSTFARLISGSTLINSKMLVAISKKTPLKEKKNLFDNSRMAMFKSHLGSRLARGLAQ